ncbi:MAG TPA: S26 family signal peptidase [Catenuloplanes sp.]|jgi:signal peptidase I
MTAAVVLVSGLVAVVAAAATFRWRYIVVTVRGDSMSPVLDNGSVVLVRRGNRCATGDIALLRLTGDLDRMVKQVAATPGDLVPAGYPIPPGTVVPPGQLLVRGTTDGSYDSRRIGYVAAGSLVGIVRRRLRTPPGTVAAESDHIERNSSA